MTHRLAAQRRAERLHALEDGRASAGPARLEAAGAPISIAYPPGMIGPDDPGLSEGNHMLRAFFKDAMVDTTSGISVFDVRDLAQVHARMVEPDDAGRSVPDAGSLPALAGSDRADGRAHGSHG